MLGVELPLSCLEMVFCTSCEKGPPCGIIRALGYLYLEKATNGPLSEVLRAAFSLGVRVEYLQIQRQEFSIF